jgi:hypothetical protein
MEFAQHGVDRLRTLQYQSLLREAEWERLVTSARPGDTSLLRQLRSARGGAIAWLRAQTLPTRIWQRQGTALCQ